MTHVEVERGKAIVALPDQPAEDDEPDDDGEGEKDDSRLGAHPVDQTAKAVRRGRRRHEGSRLLRRFGLLVVGEHVELHARPTVPGNPVSMDRVLANRRP